MSTPITDQDMNKPASKPESTPQTDVFPETLHRVRQRPNEAGPAIKSKKRANTFSQSRDTREDRGARQAKTARNPQTLPHGH